MVVVVRCTGCSGLARVGPEAVGLLVVCPRCGDPFLAEVLADPAAPLLPPPPPPAPPRRPARAEPVAPRRPRRPPPEPAPEVHDHPPPSAGGVPFSVIIGFALLPLSIPLLWLIGPVVLGQPPELTLATPIALAVTAAVLCLAVAFTVDWSPAARINGVLTLVGLAYLAGLGAYFLKQGPAEEFQRRLALEPKWADFQPPGKEYQVKMPAPVKPQKDVPAGLPPGSYHEAKVAGFGRHKFTVGSGADTNPKAADEDWFDKVGRALGPAERVAPAPDLPAAERPPHRAWLVWARDGGWVRYVQVYRDAAAGRVYVLTVEGFALDAEDEYVERFFGSFAVAGAKK